MLYVKLILNFRANYIGNMKHIKLLFSFLLFVHLSIAQIVGERLKASFNQFKSDTLLKHASISLYVVNSKTNEVVFDANSELGLVPASCMKIITSVSAYELLGKDFQYKTTIGYSGKVKRGVLDGNLIIKGYGDPTLGSWRYASTKDTAVMKSWTTAIKGFGITKINGDVYLDGRNFSLQPIPGGWSWEDMGNYYGAGCWGLNWYENQYDLTLKPGLKEGDSAIMIKTFPELQFFTLINKVKTSKSTLGADVNIYLPPYSHTGIVEGTIPIGDSTSIVSGSTANPYDQLGKVLGKSLDTAHIPFYQIISSYESIRDKKSIITPDSVFYTYLSPTLDSITYWFLHKSVNLYGESLLKEIAYNKIGEGRTEDGIGILKQFWQDRGIERSALRIKDGSGLSVTNRITTNALVNVLQYARNKDWFFSFYNALPLYNGMKLKSGTISGIKSFAGYHTSKEGVDYTISFIVNDFSGASSDITKKMFRVLDELK